jgi:hypothetical protein
MPLPHNDKRLIQLSAAAIAVAKAEFDSSPAAESMVVIVTRDADGNHFADLQFLNASGLPIAGMSL